MVTIRELKNLIPEHCARLYVNEPKVKVCDVKDAHGYDLDDEYLVAQVLVPGEEALQVILSLSLLNVNSDVSQVIMTPSSAVTQGPTTNTLEKTKAKVVPRKRAPAKNAQIKAPLPTKAPASILTPPETPPAPQIPLSASIPTKPVQVKMIDQEVISELSKAIQVNETKPTVQKESSEEETQSEDEICTDGVPLKAPKLDPMPKVETSSEESSEATSSEEETQETQKSSSEEDQSSSSSSSSSEEEESEKENLMPISPSPMPAPVILVPPEPIVQPKKDSESDSDSDHTTSSSAASPQKSASSNLTAATAKTNKAKYGTNLFKKLPARNK